jgi:hypothetical protein
MFLNLAPIYRSCANNNRTLSSTKESDGVFMENSQVRLLILARKSRYFQSLISTIQTLFKVMHDSQQLLIEADINKMKNRLKITCSLQKVWHRFKCL